MSGSLGEREMLSEYEPQVSVSTGFSSSAKLSRVFLQFERNTGNMFSISFRKHHDISSTAHAIFVFLSS